MQSTKPQRISFHRLFASFGSGSFCFWFHGVRWPTKPFAVIEPISQQFADARFAFADEAGATFAVIGQNLCRAHESHGLRPVRHNLSARPKRIDVFQRRT
jgi:hypothetical protein